MAEVLQKSSLLLCLSLLMGSLCAQNISLTEPAEYDYESTSEEVETKYVTVALKLLYTNQHMKVDH